MLWNRRRVSAGLWVMAALCLGVASASSRGVGEGLARILRDVSTDSIRTGILYDRVLPLSRIEEHDGGIDSKPTDLLQWRQMYDEMSRASLSEPSWPASAVVLARAKDRLERGILPIAVMDFRYDRIRSDAIDTGALIARDGRLTVGTPNPYVVHRVFAASALRGHTYQGSRTIFRLDAQDFVSNDAVNPRSVEIDFDDDAGFILVPFDSDITVRYMTRGVKEIRVRRAMSDADTLIAAFPFDVRELRSPAPSDTLHVTATIPYLGGFGRGDAYVYLSGQHTTLTEPVLLIEGFDPNNGLNADELYDLLNREQLLETLRSRGFDAVVLNFADGADYIQRNAFLAVELIGQIRATIGPQRTLAVAGASMGGLVGRYALCYMEAHGIPHAARTFISFDSPQKGADIPLGLQYWLWFFADLSTEAAANLADLDTPAARQMLVYHHTDPPAGGGVSDPLRAVFLSELAAVGDYPTGPRKVAIANGSGTRWNQGFTPGAQIIRWEYTSFLVDITGNCWAVPDMSSHAVFYGMVDYIFLPADEVTVTVAGTRPYDNAPGGWRDTMAQLGASDPGYGDIIALHPNHCFIPTVSALALDTTDLFYDVAGDLDILSRTPFDAVYFPTENQEHVLITPENAPWIIGEVERGVSALQEPASQAPRVASIGHASPNPFDTATTFRIQVPTSGTLRLSVHDVAGRRVTVLADRRFEAGGWTVSWDGRDHRSGSLVAPGTYFLRMQGEGFAASAKLVRGVSPRR